MPIQTKEIIEIPSKTFSKHWVTTIEISSPSPSEEALAICKLVPYNDDGEMSPAHTETIVVRDIMTKAQDQDSNMAKAMYFLLAAINEEYENV